MGLSGYYRPAQTSIYELALDGVSYADNPEVIAPAADEGFFIFMQLHLKTGYDRYRIEIHFEVRRTIFVNYNFAFERALKSVAEIAVTLCQTVGDSKVTNAGVRVN